MFLWFGGELFAIRSVGSAVIREFFFGSDRSCCDGPRFWVSFFVWNCGGAFCALCCNNSNSLVFCLCFVVAVQMG